MAPVFLRSPHAKDRAKQDVLRLFTERQHRRIDKESRETHLPDGSNQNVITQQTEEGNNAAMALVAELAAIDKPIGVKSCTLSTRNGTRQVRVSLNDLIMDRADMEQDCLEPTNLEKHLPLDNPLIIPARNTNRAASLGILAPFPNEIVDTILLVADIQTLTTLRGVNTYIRNLISEMPQYKDVYEHGVNALRAMLASGSAQYHSIRKLHTQLRSFKCSHCMEYRDENDKHVECGNQLYLPTCERYCYDCSAWLWKNRESVITEDKAIEYLGAVDMATFDNLPYIFYRRSMEPHDRSLAFNVQPFKEKKIYMQKDVNEAVIRRFGVEHHAKTPFNIYQKEISRPIPQRNKDGAFRVQIQKTGGHLRWLDRASQYFFIGLPALEDPRSGLSDWGSVCKGCYATRFERDIWHPYCEDPEPAPLLPSAQMLKHLEICKYAAELRAATMNPNHKKHEFYSLIVGERYPSESWRKGYYKSFIPSFHHEWEDDVDDTDDEDDIDDVPDNAGQANNVPDLPQAVLDEFPELGDIHTYQQGPNFVQVGPVPYASTNMTLAHQQLLDAVLHHQQLNTSTINSNQYNLYN